MPAIRIDPAGLASVLPPGGLTLLSSCSAESRLLEDAIVMAGETIGDMRFAGIFVPGLNRCRWLDNPSARALTFFMTPELKAAGARVDFRPLCYADILVLLRRLRPQAALFMLSPPDDDGMCSFGTAVDFIADLWREIPVRIAHINPSMPLTRGGGGIPFDELTAWFEVAQPLIGTAEHAGGDPVADAIAALVAPFVSDGATLQTGLGKIPGAVLRKLADRRNLRVHSGLVGDGVLALIEGGAMAPGRSATVGVAIGSERLYDALSAEPFDFQPVSITHGLSTLCAIENLVTINSAIEIDLYGQAFAELTPKGLMSGPGGAGDFARGAHAAGGLRIIALPATAGGGRIKRIVPAGAGSGPISLARGDIDIVVTEHGAADLRGRDYDGRARALIAIADPSHRDELAAGWAEQCKLL